MSGVVTSSQLFYNKLNEANPQLLTPLSPDNVTVGVPTTNTDSSITKNSMVQVTAKAGTTYSGLATAYYDRVTMADIVATVAGSNTFPYTNQTKISDCLASFNATFAVNMVAADIIDGPLGSPDPATGQINFTLAAAASSLAFMGSTPFIYVPSDLSLNTGITTTTLTGLTAVYIVASTYSGLQVIYQRVNVDNPTFTRQLSTVNITPGAVTALSGDASGKNTSITLTGIMGKGIRDQQVFKYNRVTFADLIAGSANPSNVVPNTGQATVADMLASFNTRYGTKILASEISNALTDAVVALPNSYKGVVLNPVAGHPLFNDGATVKYLVSYATLTLAGTLSHALTSAMPYSSTLAITGGSGNYSNPRVASGSKPSYLTLAISGNNIVLSGTPDAVGANFSFTIAVDSDDGQTATSPVQTLVANGGALTDLSTAIATTNLTPGLVLADMKATI
jgi:hypothetical protein